MHAVSEHRIIVKDQWQRKNDIITINDKEYVNVVTFLWRRPYLNAIYDPSLYFLGDRNVTHSEEIFGKTLIRFKKGKIE
jgi:hypothetical protein